MSSTFFFKVTGGANPLLALKKKKCSYKQAERKRRGEEEQEFKLQKGAKIWKITKGFLSMNLRGRQSRLRAPFNPVITTGTIP
jgi:hypothetical protein